MPPFATLLVAVNQVFLIQETTHFLKTLIYYYYYYLQSALNIYKNNIFNFLNQCYLSI